MPTPDSRFRISKGGVRVGDYRLMWIADPRRLSLLIVLALSSGSLRVARDTFSTGHGIGHPPNDAGAATRICAEVVVTCYGLTEENQDHLASRSYETDFRGT